MAEKSFRDLFASAYEGGKVQKRASRSSFASDRAAITDSIQKSTAAAPGALGHPDYEGLAVGQTALSKSVVFFLDIRGFTKLSFVLENEELLLILQALTTASVLSVLQFGGHVIEFTGDGIMAVFGDHQGSPEETAFASLNAASFLMNGIKNDVNAQLAIGGGESVRVGIGMEFGEILWSRIGVLGRTQVKPISEVTFLAGKLSTSKYTRSWEAKVGANLASWIQEDLKQKAPRYEFSIGDRKYSRELYLFDWQAFSRSSQANSAELRRRLLARKLEGPVTLAANVIGSTNPPSAGPRKLKDQPFF